MSIDLIRIINQGVDVWNKWVMENPYSKKNLSRTYLRGTKLCKANLRGIDFSWANLSEADLKEADLSYATFTRSNLDRVDLSGANLTGAIITGAVLSWANLTGAILREAKFKEVKFSGANLTKANLRGANLTKANLNGANLTKANLRGANLSGASLYEADLSEANLFVADLSEADLSGAVITEAYLSGANLSKANFKGAKLDRINLNRTDLSGKDFSGADLSESKLIKANLSGANLSGANLTKANLRGANLSGANLSDADLSGTILVGCNIYAISAWGLKLNDTVQSNLIITPQGESTITVDNLEVAQFVYLLSHNEKIRNVIDIITSKVVLILGRFTPERKAILVAISKELRNHDYVPIIFDFKGPCSRDFTETITTLARMSRFIIADITQPQSIPLELQAIIPDLAVPVQPLLLNEVEEFGMFKDLRRKYHWVLQVHIYKDLDDLLSTFEDSVIAPSEAKVNEIKGSQATRSK